MQTADLEDVRSVEAAAFQAAWEASHGGRRPRRTRRNALVRLEKDPDGCFVAERSGRIVGSVFSRTWGNVGWMGSLAVLPASQGRGIGRQLMAASLRYLGPAPQRLIGLETSPTDARALNLYCSSGFEVRSLTFHLSKEVDRSVSGRGHVRRWSRESDGDRMRWLDELHHATNRLIPGLDYTKEIIFQAQQGDGDTLVNLSGERAVGMCVLSLVSPLEGVDPQTATILALALDPARSSRARLRALVQAAEALGSDHGKTRICLVVSAHHVWAADQFRQWGFRVDRVRLQMTLRSGAVPPDRLVDASRWAG